MTEIDQDLYSRQIYVLGSQAMKRLTESNVLIHGIGALGIEIAKNIALAGVGSLTIMDNQICNTFDLGNQFFINEKHVESKLTRTSASFDQLQNLNPYVRLNSLDDSLNSQKYNDEAELSSFLKQFNCVIITEVKSLDKLTKINSICRENGIKFLLSDVFGLFGYSFTDFGDNFEVYDADGEEYKEIFIGTIKKSDNSDETIIQTLDERLHNLESGDLIKFMEIDSVKDINDRIFKVKVVDSKNFSIEFKIEEADLNKIQTCSGGLFKNIQALLLSQYSTNEKLTSDQYNELAKQKLEALKQSNPDSGFSDINPNEANFKNLCRIFYYTNPAKFAPLCAVFGGIIAQEAIKSITNKFIPIKQWLHLDASELFEIDSGVNQDEITRIYSSLIKNDRYDYLRLCFGGEKTLESLKKTKLFMVGCGAIGCEMLKNYALLGIANKNNNGLISITDNDLIEKSNLNRQFLFRQSDIQKSKSSVAAIAACRINPDINVVAYEKKVCPQTENELFTDDFFTNQDLCVNALDNLEARRYMDTRCVTNQKPLLESGTLGAKGHVQVIIPHLTESYNSQKDPHDNDSEIPYCTLKSFPSNIEHCIQWSRDKFESVFKIKTSLFEKFFRDNLQNIAGIIEKLKTDENYVLDGGFQVAKIARNFCHSWDDCLYVARVKFEKYFSNKAKDLMYVYPIDHLMKDGTPFWKLPKRPPKPIQFNIDDKLHLDFVIGLARLLAEIYHVKIENNELDNLEYIRKYLSENESRVPIWKPVKKHIETDETKKKDENSTTNSKDLNNAQCAEIFENYLEKLKSNNRQPQVSTLNFEKDNDKNGHIDFIYAASNLRASMYSIEHSDRMNVKKIAGKIVPAIATTTASIAGFVSIELVKIIQGNWKLEKFRNCFLNLGISLFLLSEPGPCVKEKIAENCYVSLWDKWSIKGSENFTLKNFIEAIKQKYKLTVSGVMYGSKSIYIPVMPGHAKRLNEKMTKLIKGNAQSFQKNEYVDLFLTYEECDNDTTNRDKNNLCPPIRYYLI